MTRLIYLLLAIIGTSFLLVSCQSTNEKKEQISTDVVNNPQTANGNASMDNLPKFEFANKSHDFGIIIEGEKVSYTFKFKNTGKSDLVISSSKGSCVCTVPKYDKEPIAPGKEGYVEVIFDSSGRNGMQSKTITLQANTQPNVEVLTISGEIVSPKDKK